MTAVQGNIQFIENELLNKKTTLVAVTKTKPIEMLMEVYNIGFKCFGENYVQELVDKYEAMPKDIEWHFIGHLQTNKVKYIAPFVSLIHSVDSFKLLQEINKQAEKNNRIIDCLLQIYIAQEETKTGMSEEELYKALISKELIALKNIRIVGLMGMASFTDNESQLRNEFKLLKTIFDTANKIVEKNNMFQLKTLSMGMSSDYEIAMQEGSTMIRVGSKIFGNRIYQD